MIDISEDPIVIKLITHAKERKTLTWDELADLLPEKMTSSEAVMDEILDLLEQEQIQVVERTLADLGCNEKPSMIVFNKIDNYRWTEKDEDDLTPETRENITLEATNEAIDYLAKRGYDPQFGARPVKRVIQKEVMNALSKEILQGKIKAGSLVLIDSFDNGLVFRNKTE